MKRASAFVAFLALVALGAACDTGSYQATEQEGSAMMMQPDTTITLSLEDGQIVVDPDPVNVKINGVVRWASKAGESPVWVVVFADSTPMKNGRRVFNGGTAPGSSGQAQAQGPVGSGRDLVGKEFKYWVFYPDGQGGYIQKDPKLVIIDDPGADTTTSE